MTKLNTLEIQNFRHIQNQTVEFGKYLTVITGLNGTGKSSILGWIAQLCDYKSKDMTILDTFFKEDYKNVFRFCPDNDYTPTGARLSVILVQTGARLSVILVLDCIEYLFTEEDKTKRLQRG